jgi:chemotaxis protein MotB
VARRKKQPERENHERWLVSYADFITLLFAFFVVMFATSQADKGKAERVSQSVREALEEGGLSTLVASILGGTVGDTGQGNAQHKGPGGAEIAKHEGEEEGLKPGAGRAIVELKPALKFLTEALSEQIANGQMEVTLEDRGLVVSFREVMLFRSGEATLIGDNLDAIDKVARVIRELPNPVRMEGHTDSVPIHNAHFASNWELSAARAITMLELFAGRYEISRDKMSIAAYADNAPVASNEIEEGRARNRRVDIILLSEIGLQAEPPAAPGRPGSGRATESGGTAHAEAPDGEGDHSNGDG